MAVILKEGELMDFVLDPETLLEGMPTDKLRMLSVELDMIMEDYSRELAIAYLSSNYSSKKHLCSTVLRGKHDYEIKDAASRVKIVLITELASRRNR
ncbi:MAG: hypothetical protein LBV13_01060 [Methanomassiliicoccaceae archaeon]|jgi:hypothetical protein|nr:hypothetical protein [Methanomassiliicoccaceae archaeon]